MSKKPDENKFIEELTRHQPALEAFCYAKMARAEEALEVLQSTSVTLWQKSSDWNPETPFLPWAFTVARYVVLTYYRDRKRDRLIFDEDVMLAMADDTEAAAGRFDVRKEALGACMQQLKLDQRSLLSSHYVSGYSISELASSAGCGESAIKMKLLRLRQILRQCVEQRIGTES